MLHPVDKLEWMKPAFDRLAELAAAQDNVVTRAQLHALRFLDQRIASMLKHRHWVQLQRGVYLLGPGPGLLWWGVEGPADGPIDLTLLEVLDVIRASDLPLPARNVRPLSRRSASVSSV